MNTIVKILVTLLKVLANLWLLFAIWWISDRIISDAPSKQDEWVKWIIWLGGSSIWYMIIEIIPKWINDKFEQLKVDMANKYSAERLETINYIQSWVKHK